MIHGFYFGRGRTLREESRRPKTIQDLLSSSVIQLYNKKNVNSFLGSKGPLHTTYSTEKRRRDGSKTRLFAKLFLQAIKVQDSIRVFPELEFLLETLALK